MWESWVGMAAQIGEMKGASCLNGGTSWRWCWEMASGPVLMGVVPFLHPASFAMGQGAYTQSPPAPCPHLNEEGRSVSLCRVLLHMRASRALSSAPLQPVGGMSYGGSEPMGSSCLSEVSPPTPPLTFLHPLCRQCVLPLAWPRPRSQHWG